ncbi:MAG: alpha/beta hydrolase [Christensenellales bacterium]
MPKFFSTLLRMQIRMFKPFIRSLKMDTQRRAQDRLGRLGASVLKEKIYFQQEVFSCFQADWAIPLHERKNGAILYMHGGGYTSGCLAYARSFGGILADTTKRGTLCIEYRLAPENPFPAALDDALEAYKRILETEKAQNIILAGESAGGGLAFALVLRLKDEGYPLPGCIIAISPWTDLTMSGASYMANARKDPSLNDNWLRQSVQMYCNGDCKNPYISPVYGDLKGLPPCLIFAGTYELLLDDAVNMAKKLRASGVLCEDHFVEGMWHAYVLFGIAEAKEALKRISGFIDENTKDTNE